MFKRISFYLLLTSCAFGQNFGFPNTIQVTTVGGGTNSGSSSGGTNITIVGSTNVVFTTNQAFGTTYTNLYSVPITVFGGEVILSNTGTGASGITFSAISGGVIGVGTTAAGIWSVAIPTFSVAAGGTWSYTDVSTGTSKSFLLPASFQVALTSPVNGAITVTSLPVTIPNGGTGQTTASAARTALGTAGLTDNNTFSGTSNYFANRLTANNVSFSFDGSLTETVTINANGQLGQILWVDGENGITFMDYVGQSGWDLFYTFKADGVSFGGPDAASSELNTLDFGDVNSSHRFSIGTNDVLTQGLALPVRYVNGNFTISILDNTVYEISNNAVITLPTALDLQKTDGTSYLPGHLYWLTFLTNGSCTINSTSNQTIGQSALTNFVLSGNGATVALQSNGTNAWNILNSVSGSGVSPVVIITNGWTSPHTWTNTNSFPAQLILQGWTISSISINGTVVGSSALGFEIVPGLRPLDTFSMTYTVGGNAWFRPQ